MKTPCILYLYHPLRTVYLYYILVHILYPTMYFYLYYIPVCIYCIFTMYSIFILFPLYLYYTPQCTVHVMSYLHTVYYYMFQTMLYSHKV